MDCTRKIGIANAKPDRTQLVGDDLFVTNTSRLKGIQQLVTPF